MRKFRHFFLLSCIAASVMAFSACEDSNQADSVCDKACGHGSCFMQVTKEACLCDEGFALDADGACTVVSDVSLVLKSQPYNEGTIVRFEIELHDPAGALENPVVTVKRDDVVLNTTKNGEIIVVSDDIGNAASVTYTVTVSNSNNIVVEPIVIPFRVDGACADISNTALVLSEKPSVDGTTVSFGAVLCKASKAADPSGITVKRDGTALKTTLKGKNVIVSEDVGNAKKVSYTVSVSGSDGADIDALYVPVWNESEQFDWHNAVMYFAFIDRFYNGNPANDNKLNIAQDWYGGDFSGLKKKVEEGYFDKLGVNALWISSVSMNTQRAVGQFSAYHSYWPISTGYTDKTASMFDGYNSNGIAITPIEPHFGTLDELRALVKACHDRGIRVLVDFAVNHVDEDSPVFKLHPEWFNGVDVADRDSILCEGPTRNGQLSQDNWNIIPETCWFSSNLPDFNYNIAEVRKFVVDHAKWLIQTTDIDGFRLDAVKHMPIQLIKDLRSGVNEMFSGTGLTFYIVGETFDGEDKIKQYIGDDLLHGQFDFPLYNTLRGTIMNGDGKFWDLKDFVPRNDTTYGSALMSTFLGNHDVARAISHIHHDGEQKTDVNQEVSDTWAYRQLRLAWVFLLTSPMIPMIYYGDEYGLEGANDPDNRRMMEFDSQLNAEQKKTLELVQKLGQLRHKHPALWRGKRQNIDAYARAYAYLMKDDNETILVGICDADDDQTFNVPGGEKGWIDLLDESNVINDTTSVTLNFNRQIVIWKLKN